MNIHKKLKDLREILSKQEINAVVKRLENKPISQTESNYLSRSVRPKLRAAQAATSLNLLSLLNYRRKKHERENKMIKEQILKSVENVLGKNNIQAIILYGSYVQNSHANYRDIDVMIILNKKIWKTSAEKNRMEKVIESGSELGFDINLVPHKELMKILPYSPLLQTELEEHELIYGNINLIKKIKVDKSYLYSKLLDTETILELGKDIETKYIYNALRTCISIKLFLKKIVDNDLILNEIGKNIGMQTMESLIENNANNMQREIALRYLEYLFDNLKKELIKDE